MLAEQTTSGKSLINKTKDSGPRIDPCGTPEVISVKEDERANSDWSNKGKECGSKESSRLWGGALRDEPKNGCEGD